MSAFTRTLNKVKDKVSVEAGVELPCTIYTNFEHVECQFDTAQSFCENMMLTVQSLVPGVHNFSLPGPWLPSIQVSRNDKEASTSFPQRTSSYMNEEASFDDNYRAPNKSQKLTSTLSRVCV